MFTYSLGAIDEPMDHIAISTYFFSLLQGHIDYEIVSEKLKLLICDPYEIKEFSIKDIELLCKTFSESDLDSDLDQDISKVLKKIKAMFSRAQKQNLTIYGVGD